METPLGQIRTFAWDPGKSRLSPAESRTPTPRVLAVKQLVECTVSLAVVAVPAVIEVGLSRSWVTLVAAWAGVASETAASAAAPAIPTAAPRRAEAGAGMRMTVFLCDACE